MHLQYYRCVSPEMASRFSRVIGIVLQKLGITHTPPCSRCCDDRLNPPSEFGSGLVALQGFDCHLGPELRLVLAPSGWHWRLFYASVPEAEVAVQDPGSTSDFEKTDDRRP